MWCFWDNWWQRGILTEPRLCGVNDPGNTCLCFAGCWHFKFVISFACNWEYTCYYTLIYMFYQKESIFTKSGLRSKLIKSSFYSWNYFGHRITDSGIESCFISSAILKYCDVYIWLNRNSRITLLCLISSSIFSYQWDPVNSVKRNILVCASTGMFL